MSREKSHSRSGAVSEDGKYLIVSVAPGGNDNLLFYADLAANGEITNKIPLTPFVTEFNGSYNVSKILSKCIIKMIHSVKPVPF